MYGCVTCMDVWMDSWTSGSTWRGTAGASGGLVEHEAHDGRVLGPHRQDERRGGPDRARGRTPERRISVRSLSCPSYLSHIPLAWIIHRAWLNLNSTLCRSRTFDVREVECWPTREASRDSARQMLSSASVSGTSEFIRDFRVARVTLARGFAPMLADNPRGEYGLDCS